MKIKPLVLIGLPIGIALALSLYTQATILANPERAADFLRQFGPFIIVAYVVLQAVTIVLAPIGGYFLQIALLSLFDPKIAFLIIYLTVTPVYLINFYLSRKYGRNLVQKIVGKTALEKIDHLAADAGTVTIIILKVLQGGIFDYLSYAIGLTKIPFKTFFWVNVLGGIPSAIVSYFIITRFGNLTQGIIALIVVAYVLGGLSIYLNHHLRKRRLSKVDK